MGCLRKRYRKKRSIFDTKCTYTDYSYLIAINFYLFHIQKKGGIRLVFWAQFKGVKWPQKMEENKLPLKFNFTY